MPLFLIIALLLGGSATVASENSLPGDLLYPVKVNVNESVRGAIAIGAEADGEWHARQAERRLEEAIELASKNELSNVARAEIEQRFLEAAVQVEARIKELQKEDPAAAAALASRFEASLEAHARLLGKLKTSAHGASEISMVVRQQEATTSTLRARNEASIIAKAHIDASARDQVSTAAQAISTARASLDKARARAGIQATADAEARLSVAEANLTNAKSHLEAHNYAEAYARGSEARRAAQEAEMLSNSNFSIGITLGGANSTEVDGKKSDASPSTTNGTLDGEAALSIKIGQ